MLTLVLTRHGLTTRSHPEQHLGQKIDLPLSDEGRRQAEALGARLESISFARIVSSPLVRARQTAEAVAAASGRRARLSVEMDPRLLEMDYGRWEGLTYEQIDGRDGDRRHRWEADPAASACPDGESGNDVASRARAFILDLLHAEEGSCGSASSNRLLPVLAVGHSTFNRVLLCLALAIPIREFRARLVQDQVNVTALHWESGARPNEAKLLLLNDVSHVRRPDQPPWD